MNGPVAIRALDEALGAALAANERADLVGREPEAFVERDPSAPGLRIGVCGGAAQRFPGRSGRQRGVWPLRNPLRRRGPCTRRWPGDDEGPRRYLGIGPPTPVESRTKCALACDRRGWQARLWEVNTVAGRILVGVDGSEGSRRALRWAIDEATARGATLDAILAAEP